MEKITKDLTFKAENVDLDSRSFEAVITSDALDRDGEVLLPEGMDATDFNKNPIVFWNHNYDKPIGKAVKMVKDKNSWKAVTQLAKRPEDHVGEWLPDVALALIKQGVIKGVSVSFLPTDYRQPSKKDKSTFGEGVKRVFTKWKLLEYSVAPLQCNQDALVTAVGKGIVSAEMAKQFGYEAEAEPKPKAVETITIVQRKVKKRSLKDQVAIAIAKRKGQAYLD